jgi:alpha-tubulin suppressor-like RCC1 family protein
MPTISEIQTCIDNLTPNSEPIDFVVLAAQTGSGNNGIAFSVSSVDDLPDLFFSNMNDAQIIFVESIQTPVFNSGFKWKGLDGRTLRDDYKEQQIWSWGRGLSGELGDGTVVTKCSPVREISSSTDWCQVSVAKGGSSAQTSALKTTGEIWSWGCGANSRLGDGSAINRCSPVREISSSTNWCQVSVADFHTSAIKTTGEIWSWGANSGRLGDGTTVNTCSPVREISSSTDWCQVSAGGGFSSAIKTTGEIWGWGFGSCGRLGDGTTVTKCSPVREISSSTDWCQVSGGDQHTSAVKTTGEIWSWGGGCDGRLGDGTTVSKCSPVREISSSTDWCQVSAGGQHASAVKTTGEIWSWGCGTNGRLGDGTIVAKCSPVRERCSSTDWCQVSAGGLHTSALKTTGEIWGWGTGGCGRIGDGTATTRTSPVREISSSTDWCQVSAGCQHTSAIKLV